MSRHESSWLETELPPFLGRVAVAAGTIYIEASPELAAAGPSLTLNGARSHFLPLPEEALAQLDLALEFRPDFQRNDLFSPCGNASEELPDTIASCSVSGLPEWALANRETLQFELRDRHRPVSMALCAPIKVPPQTREMDFRAGLAAHRGRGALVVEVFDTASGKTHVSRFPFNNSHRGGIAASGYLQVSHPLPASTKGLTITLTLDYEAFEEEAHDFAPFLFLADPHVGPRYTAGRTRANILLQGGASRAEPDSLAGHQDIAGSSLTWLQAPLPKLLRANETLQLTCGSSTLALASGNNVKFSLEEDQGHTLVMRTEISGEYAIYLDGVHAFDSYIGSSPTAVRIPPRFLTGNVTEIAICDHGAMQLFWRSAVLLPRNMTPMEVLQRESVPPLPGTLPTQAGHRYEALKAQLRQSLKDAERQQLSQTLTALEAGSEAMTPKPLRFPEVTDPEVSVVIPAHNNFPMTYLALCSLLLAYNQTRFEVIVVDDGSTDKTAELESLIEGITVVHFATPQRFIRACNKGVEYARGDYIVLLNNDTEVTNGWLDALLDAFKRFDNVGIAGAKLLYPDGRLQDAGGVVWHNGNPWNYGNSQNPWEPRFCYARQADYLSGAALMISREVWQKVGGLSSYLEPMYFEDTDLAFKVREAGYSTWFIPEAVVYHHEGATSGTDVTQGYKRHQEVNRPRFKRRWSNAFRPFGPEGVNPDLEKDRNLAGRALFIDYETPRPDRDAGSYAAIQEISLVRSLGYKVTFLPQNLAYLGEYTHALQRTGVEVIYAPFCLSMEEYLTSHAQDFDVIYITRYYVAREVIDTIRRVAPHAKIIFNNADLHFLRELRTGIALNDPSRLDAAERTREAEVNVMSRVDLVLSYNESEHAVIQTETRGRVPVLKCPWVVGMPDAPPGPKGRNGLSFLGSFRHHPNSEGITWFSNAILPGCLKNDPDLTLWIYGSGMDAGIQALASPNIRPAGFVPDVADAYVRHRVFVAPLLSGAGIKGKVLSALAHGIPAVLSPVAAEGIGLRDGHDCFIAETPQEWQNAIVALEDDTLWQNLSDNARDFVAKTYSFERGRDLMRRAFETVDLYPAE